MAVPSNEEEQTELLEIKKYECLQRKHNLTQGFCPKVWDGILCWSETPPSNLVSQWCPSYLAGFNTGNATKYCTSNGTWFYNHQLNNTWTNYTQCFNGSTANILVPFPKTGNVTLLAKYLPVLKTLSQIGYGFSLLTLIIAFIILASFKRLRCPRNILHMHLFFSFILRAAVSILKDTLFVRGIGLPSDLASSLEGELYFSGHVKKNWSCKLVTSLWQYCIIANYSWILMEGLYLHNLIFLALFSDTSAITVYIILGWSLPLVFVIPWVMVRATLEDNLCWTTHNNYYYFLLIKIPIIASMLLNFGLFLNIVRVLLLKLTASITEEKRRYRYRRWAKSTLVLVPLFGVHYALFVGMSYSIGVNETIELVWLFCDQFFASFQGSFVAVLYCFLNGEVREVLKKRGKNQRKAYSMSDKSSAPIAKFFRAGKNRKRGGSTFESCMTSFISSVTTDVQRRATLPPHEIINQMSESKLDISLLQRGDIPKNDIDVN